MLLNKHRFALILVVVLVNLPALGDDFSFPSLQSGQNSMPPPPLPSSDGLAWPPPGGRQFSSLPDYGQGRPGGMVAPSQTVGPAMPPGIAPTAPPPVAPSVAASLAPYASSAPAAVNRAIESTWYYRQDAFYWNERSDGTDFVNEAGPISTIGYLRRNGCERFRFELFGGTVSYDGGAQFEDGTTLPYHESFGTNYLGLRGEYDLLIEPTAWPRVRFLMGVGTRFWIRDLRDAETSFGEVDGYQETWWTFYPYLGLETRQSDEPGLKFYGSARFGITPLTYQYATYFDTTVYPRCGVTGRVELGVTYHRLSALAVVEGMTWGESAVVRDTFQPASRMLTIGGQIGYTF